MRRTMNRAAWPLTSHELDAFPLWQAEVAAGATVSSFREWYDDRYAAGTAWGDPE